MIGGSTALHGGFFEQAPAGRGFASVPNLHRMRFHGFDIAPGLRGDAAEALEEIQRGAFSSEKGSSGALGLQKDAFRLKRLPVGDEHFDFDLRINLPKHGFDDFHAGYDAWLTTLATRTGGAVGSLADLPRFIRSVPPKSHVERRETVWRPWNSGWTIALLGGLLILEWIWRKWEGLV